MTGYSSRHGVCSERNHKLAELAQSTRISSRRVTCLRRRLSERLRGDDAAHFGGRYDGLVELRLDARDNEVERHSVEAIPVGGWLCCLGVGTSVGWLGGWLLREHTSTHNGKRDSSDTLGHHDAFGTQNRARCRLPPCQQAPYLLEAHALGRER